MRSAGGWWRALALIGLVACDDSDSSVTIRMPKAPDAVVVYRDGDGPWTATTGAAGSVRFSAPSGRYTVVVGCNYGQDGRASAYALTPAELSTIDYQGECDRETQVLSGQLLGVTGGTAFVVWGLSIIELVSGTSSFTVEPPRGTGDLLAMAGSRVVVARDVALGASPVSVDLDLTGPSAADLVQRRLTLSSARELYTRAYGSLWTEGGTYASLCASDNPTACSLPEAALAPGDLHVMRVESTETSTYRAARWAVHMPSDREFVVPATTQVPPQATIANQGASVAISVAWPGAPSAPLYRLSARQTNTPPTYRFWQIVVSEGFLDSEVSFSLPDLSGVEGWDPGIDLVAGSYVEWQVAGETGASLDELVRWLPTQEGTIFEDGFRGAVTPQ